MEFLILPFLLWNLQYSYCILSKSTSSLWKKLQLISPSAKAQSLLAIIVQGRGTSMYQCIYHFPAYSETICIGLNVFSNLHVTIHCRIMHLAITKALIKSCWHITVYNEAINQYCVNGQEMIIWTSVQYPFKGHNRIIMQIKSILTLLLLKLFHLVEVMWLWVQLDQLFHRIKGNSKKMKFCVLLFALFLLCLILFISCKFLRFFVDRKINVSLIYNSKKARNATNLIIMSKNLEGI